VYSLPSGYLAVTGEVIQASQHNPALEDLASAMSQRLMRSGAAPMTGPLKIVDGTVGSPGLQFSNATSTGIYKTADGFGISIGGSRVAEFVAGGIVKGAKFIGEIFDWTGTAAPALCVLPYGQTLSRTTYADLWEFAQTEIAAGNTFYNNGNGTTTFGIGDCRGRVRASRDNMGGTDAGRLTDAVAGIGDTMGEAGGAQTHTLTASQLPSSIPYTDTGHTHAVSFRLGVGDGGLIPKGGSADNSTFLGSTVSTATTGITINPSGGSAHNNVQPTIVMHCALFAGA
jgi:microcystin-dependent protein